MNWFGYETLSRSKVREQWERASKVLKDESTGFKEHYTDRTLLISNILNETLALIPAEHRETVIRHWTLE